MRPPALLLLAALVAGATSCATHSTTLRSVPGDADVYVLDDEDTPTAVGKTPMQLPLGYGLMGRTETFLVASGDQAIRFSVVRGRVTPASAGSAVASAALATSLCGSVSVLSGALGVLALPLLPVALYLSPAAFCVAGCSGLVVALQPGICLMSMWAPPDVVEVRLPEEEEGQVASVPGGLVKDVAAIKRPPDAREAPRQRRPPGPGPIDILY